MNIRLLSVSAVAAITLTCAKTASAGTSVQLSYVAPAGVYAPRPVYYYAPPPRPAYYYVPSRTIVVAPVAAPVAVIAPPPPPRPAVSVSAYSAAPAVRVTYAQPVLVTPTVVVR